MLNCPRRAGPISILTGLASRFSRFGRWSGSRRNGRCDATGAILAPSARRLSAGGRFADFRPFPAVFPALAFLPLPTFRVCVGPPDSSPWPQAWDVPRDRASGNYLRVSAAAKCPVRSGNFLALNWPRRREVSCRFSAPPFFGALPFRIIPTAKKRRVARRHRIELTR